MKKVVSFFVVLTFLNTHCMKTPLRKANSDPSFYTVVPKGKKVSFAESSSNISVQNHLGVAFYLLVRGKKLRRDHEVNNEANELYFIARKINPHKRELLEDVNEIYFIKKIVNSKEKKVNKKI